MNYHIRENLIYSKIIKELNSFHLGSIGQYNIQIPKLIYSKCTEKDFVIVMENLKSAGYVMNPKQTSLDLEMIVTSIKQLASLHATSYACWKKDEFLSDYPCFEFNDRPGMFFGEIFRVCLMNTIKYLEHKGGFDKVIRKLKQIQPNANFIYEYLWSDHQTPLILCLTHGDFWNNNLMFLKEGKETKTERIKVMLLDWQMCHWGNPIRDIMYLIYSSTSYKLRKEYLDEILRIYHSTFIEIATALNNRAIYWNYENFMKEIDCYSFMGFAYGVTLPQIFLSENISIISGAKVPVPSPAEMKIKTTLAKMFLPFVKSAPMKFLFRQKIKQVIGSAVHELISERNMVLNNRLLDIVEEAESSGLFDKIIKKMLT